MPSPDPIDDILTRFPGPVTLYPSRKKWVTVSLGCAVFVAIAIWMVGSSDPEAQENRLMAWFALVFFGLGVIVAIAAMLPGAGGLKLDRESFAITNLFRAHSTRWRDASGFVAAKIPPARSEMVVFDEVNAKDQTLAKLNASIAGRTSALPDTYGMSASDLASLMAQWRDRAVSRR